MREITYSETMPGVFEPEPSRAQKRRAKREREDLERKRKSRWEMIGGVLLMMFVVIGYGATFGVWIFAERIWPIR